MSNESKRVLKIFVAPEFFFRDGKPFSKDRKDERFYDFKIANTVESLFQYIF